MLQKPITPETRAEAVDAARAQLELQRERLRHALSTGGNDPYARRVGPMLLARIDRALTTAPAAIEIEAALLGPNGRGPEIDDIIRRLTGAVWFTRAVPVPGHGFAIVDGEGAL